MQGNEILWSEGNKIYAGWVGPEDSSRSNFAAGTEAARDRILAYSGAKNILQSDFYPGRNDVYDICRSRRGLRFRISRRDSGKNAVKFVPWQQKSFFRGFSGDAYLYVSDGGSFYKVALQ